MQFEKDCVRKIQCATCAFKVRTFSEQDFQNLQLKSVIDEKCCCEYRNNDNSCPSGCEQCTKVD